MNKKQILLRHAGTPVAELPDAVRAVVEADAALLQVFHEQALTASLLKLKNYETPDPAMEGRTLYRVGLRIQNGEHLYREPFLDSLPDWARMMAVVLVMLALSVITHREMLTNPEGTDPVLSAAAPDAPPVYVQPLTDPFGPIYVTFDSQQDTSHLLTPEFTRELEASMLELGLNLTNRQENLSLLPVLFKIEQ